MGGQGPNNKMNGGNVPDPEEIRPRMCEGMPWSLARPEPDCPPDMHEFLSACTFLTYICLRPALHIV
eukprot:scaffold7391_cov198-Prasinococcus_capsulatus_cf.AAC.2